MEKDLFICCEVAGEANESCVRMCYNPNKDNLLTTEKEDGLVEVYACQFNCLQKMFTAHELFSQYSATHPRFVARAEQLKTIREEQQKAIFYYGSKDHQNFQIWIK